MKRDLIYREKRPTNSAKPEVLNVGDVLARAKGVLGTYSQKLVPHYSNNSNNNGSLMGIMGH